MDKNTTNKNKLTAFILAGTLLFGTATLGVFATDAPENVEPANEAAESVDVPTMEVQEGDVISPELDEPEVVEEDAEEVTATADEEEPVEEVVIGTASSAEVAAIINGEDTETVLVDARPQEAYAGWKLQGAANGGHLKGAYLYSARFLGVGAKASKITSYDKTFGLSADNSYIIYDYDGVDKAAQKVAEYFVSQGVTNVKVYDAKTMIDNGSNVVDYGKDAYQMYLPTEIVKDVSDYVTGKDKTLDALTKEVFTEADMERVILIDVDYGNANETDYTAKGHIPGAIHINSNAYERPRMYIPEKREDYGVEYRLIGLDEFRDELCPRYGITKDSIVIAMSTDGRPISRIGFMLKTIGVEFYGVTGLRNAWTYNKYPVDKEIVKPTPVKEFGDTSPIDYDKEIMWEDNVKAILSGETPGVVYGGTNYSTYSYNDLMGTIEGIKSASDPYSMNVDGTPAQREFLEQGYTKAGFDMNAPIVPFCGDGWGASRVAYNAQAVGLSNVKYWGEGWVYWANEGNWFITKSGVKVRYNKYRDSIVGEDGKDVSPEVSAEARKPE